MSAECAESGRLGLFEAVGIEIEYMIVARDSLDVRPFADRVLAAANGGEITSEVELGALAWSNELVSHVIELKTAGPAAAVDQALLDAFQSDVGRIDELLESHGARLLPSAMHPWMDPLRETVLWPHDYSPVYEAYDRIFGCQGHGWSNLQSLHLNYPFDGDEEFARLHGAIRLVLPLLPALAASSPIVEGRLTGFLDNRLEFYRTNSRKIPSVAGEIIPEPIDDEAGYRERIFERMYRDIAPHDPQGLLQHEFLNSRGAIARFDRGAIEIRLIDVQECPRADLAIAVAVTGVLRSLVEAADGPTDAAPFATRPLAELLRQTSRRGAAAEIDDAAYLRAFGFETSSMNAGELWRRLIERAAARGFIDEPWASTLDEMLRLGPLAARIVRLLGEQGGTPSRATLRDVYRRLAESLHAGELLRA